MPERSNSLVSSAVQLTDADSRYFISDSLLGLACRIILILLMFSTLAFALLTISTSAVANAVIHHAGPIYVSQRVTFIAATLITGAALALLSRPLNNTWAWTKLPTSGLLRASKRGLHVRHAAVLDGEVLLPWSNIKAITMDSGINHDVGMRWRRFPLPSPTGEREYLFDSEGEPRLDCALIAGRPTAPNVAILLNNPVALHNPHSQLIDVAFSSNQSSGLPVLPPAGHTAATGLLLRTGDLQQTRRLLMPSGKLRALRHEDLD